MSNFQTLKNSIKKLESKNVEEDRRQFSGVICQEEFEKLEHSDAPMGGINRNIGYLLVPHRLTEAEWEAKHGF